LNKLVLILLFILIQDLRGIPSINSVFYNVDCNATEGMIIENGIITIYGKNLLCQDDTTLSVNSVSSNEIKLYPNPTNDVFYICSNQNYDVEIYDVSGRFVSNSQNLLNYTNGIYFVKVKTENSSKTFKVIKK